MYIIEESLSKEQWCCLLQYLYITNSILVKVPKSLKTKKRSYVSNKRMHVTDRVLTHLTTSIQQQKYLQQVLINHLMFC
jgi:hypothetical protein